MQNENTRKYRSFYENHPLIHVTTDYDFIITSINQNGAKELGYEVSELIGSNLFRLFISEEPGRFEKQLQYALLNPKGQSSHEMKMMRKNGQEFWVRETIYITDNSSLNKEIFFVFDNITFQKKAESDAKILAQSLQNMLDASPLGVLVYRLDDNNDFILITTNQSTVGILKIDTYKLISRKIQEIFPSLVGEQVQILHNVLKTGQPLLNQNLNYKDVHFEGVYEFSVLKLSNKTIAVFFTDVTDKTRALSALKQNELKYKTLFESSNDAIFLVKDEIIIDCNEKAMQMYKAPKEEIIGKTVYFYSPEFQQDGHPSKSKAKEKISLALKGELQSFEWRHLHLDRTEFDAEISIKKIELLNEVYLQAIVRDITERKRAEKIISEQKREIATLMDNLPGMAYRCANNFNWTMEFLSDGCYPLTGYSKDELLDDKILSYANLIHKEDQLLVYETIQNAVKNKEQFTLLYRVNTKQGYEKWVWEKGCAVYDKAGEVICLEGFITDITERKLIEEKNIILAHALKSVSECVWIVNMRDKIVFVNKSFTRVYGYSLEEMINKPVSFIRSEKNDPKVLKKIYPETLAGGWSGELINKRKSGEEFPVHLSTSLITDDAGKPIALAGVSVDITQAKKNELDLIEAKEKAEQASRLKSNFFTNISHELRTPLVGILGFAEILKDEVKNPHLSDMAEMILSSGKRLMETLNSVLDLSRIEADKFELKNKSVDLNIFADENIKMYQPVAEKKGLKLIVKKAKQNVNVYVDEQILYQILNNLIGNAIKYTLNGTVTLEVKTINKQKKEYASIAVIDTGIGIKKENLNHIFEEFRQVSEGLNRHFEGTGLGLTITKKMIELMSGEVVVKSSFGKGSSFEVLFPLHKFKVINESTEVHKAPKQLPEEKFALTELPDVLIVDNDEASRDIIRLFLKNTCNVDSAKSGEEAIKLVKAKPYKIIFMDINLGKGLSGIEAIQKIKKLRAYKNTPIVAVTAFAMTGEKEEFLRKGCTHYLSKPFMKKDLLKLIKSILY